MQTIRLNLRKYPYNIFIGYNIIKSLGKIITGLNIGRDAYIITNRGIRNRWGNALAKSLKEYDFNAKFKDIPDTEKSKSIETAYSLIKDIARFDEKKRSFLVAFGGGVIGDLTGFIASIYKRGVPYIQIPTTLLAQVDSSIGGKTAVDLAQGKNLVGAFYHPRAVFSDIRFLATLDKRQLRSGLSEVIKYGIIKDRELFSYLEKRHKDILSLNPACLKHIVERCSYIKAKIVESDEREERGIRTALNFGHTVGHAIETASDFKRYGHGEAVALGMLVACDISLALRLIDGCQAQRIENLIKRVGLPVKIQGISLQKIINAHYHDKKFIGPRNRFVLIEKIGKAKIKQDIPLKTVKEAIRKRI